MLAFQYFEAKMYECVSPHPATLHALAFLPQEVGPSRPSGRIQHLVFGESLVCVLTFNFSVEAAFV